MVKLTDITSVVTCGIAARPEYVNDGVMFLSSKNVKQDRFILDDYKMVSYEDYLKLTKYSKPEYGDILYTRVGSFGEAAVIDFNNDISIFVSLTLIKPIHEKVYNRYLMYFLNSDKTRSFANSNTTGIGVKNLNVSVVREYDIPLPPLEAQKKISVILDKASELIEKRKMQIAKLDELTKSIFIDMFGEPMKNSKGWEVKKLEEICDICRGGSPRPIADFLGGTIPWIKIGDATKGSELYLDKTKEYIIESGIKKSRLINKGSLIFANCGVSLGFARIIRFDGCIHDGWLSFENIKVNKIFLLKSLNHCTDFFRNSAPDGTQPNLNTSIMKKFMQINPPIQLQNQFSEIAEKIEEQKVLLNQGLEKFELNYKSLMQKLFN